MESPAVPQGFMNLAESALNMALRHWKTVLKWGAWYALSLAACLAALAAVVLALWVPMFDGLTGSSAPDPFLHPLFIPAILGGSAAILLFLAAATAAFISGVRLTRDLWSGAAPAPVRTYVAAGWRETFVSIPFFLRAAWYVLWPALAAGCVAGAAASAAFVAQGETGAVGGVAAGVAILFAVPALILRSVRTNVAGAQAAWDGDWSGASFRDGLETAAGNFWAALWYSLGFGVLASVAQNIAVGIPAGAVASVVAPVAEAAVGVPGASEMAAGATAVLIGMAGGCVFSFLNVSFMALLAQKFGQRRRGARNVSFPREMGTLAPQ